LRVAAGDIFLGALEPRAAILRFFEREALILRHHPLADHKHQSQPARPLLAGDRRGLEAKAIAFEGTIHRADNPKALNPRPIRFMLYLY
jgi:hypothetical protein